MTELSAAHAADPATTLEGAHLTTLGGPHTVRALPAGQLAALAQDIRTFLIEKVCAAGGHLGPNLGVVELTIALHRVFDSPRDAILFDTGHQAYVHKILTGRAAGFDRLRQAGGLSGYPSRTESVHDWCENSHASTSLSYADGLAKANELRGRHNRSVVAVIGDGAMTGGMAWEALNNIGASQRPVVVVLNDNGRSYAPTTGALTRHLHALKHPGDHTHITDDQAAPDLFTQLGFTYLGPVDGHDTGALQHVLDHARALRRPVLVHAVTVKGWGFGPAEGDEADCLHAVGTVDAVTGKPAPTDSPPAASWTSVFSQALLELADEREDLVAVTASMLRPTGLYPMAVKHPERVFDVGIAEQYAVTSAAGLALGGFHPVVALYSTFLTRAADQVLMDVALHRLPVTFVLDRAGVTGPDGASHHGMWDASMLGMVPGLRLALPRDSSQLRSLLRQATAHEAGPTAVRFPKGTAGPDLEAVRRAGSVDILSESGIRDVLLISYGPLAPLCLQAAVQLTEQGIGVSVADPRWATPVAPELLELAARHRLVITVEDNSRTGGLGSTLAQHLQDNAITTPIRTLGLPRAFLTHGPREQLLTDAGLSSTQIAYTVLRARAGKPHEHTITDGSPQ
ncbi:1-deoxy-D-xylulose-5-phosphate synthase [Streptomyces sp. NBC_01558]|uniref:1-deoxy-D-xylulose-5-phosphate synthase n=1 Tax=Streptomyces sp. NBC_01558 TaxID=2975878 RepID=UPI002DD9DA88|nr:1-deoxy-D-xylulose-5-phosphate synthase [Streptomyces sp. NBC_01558]WSD74965.1 1-deoxy-D-xylulose-5-phosphate synthase [Streptomyces sp. NBC_01558]